MHLRNLKLANPTAHQKRAQALLQKNQKARPKAAMALQAPDHLVRRMPVLKANPTVELASRLQAWDLLVYRMMSLKTSLTVGAVHRLQVVDLQAHRMQTLKAIPTMRAAHHLQGRGIRQQESSSHPLGNHWHKVANRKLGLPDRCQRLVPKLSRAVPLGRTFPS